MKKKTGTPKDFMKSLRSAVMPLALAALAAPLAGAACEDSPLGDLAEQCGLTCNAKGVLEGNATISGIPNIDAFFGAVVDLRAAAATINGSIRAELDGLALSLGLEEGAAAADIKAALEAKLTASVSGGLTVKYQEPKCAASLEVTASAAASCDAEVDPGSVEVKCEGSCTIDASAQASCTGESKLTCKGTAPNLDCSGTCTGSCELQAAAACEGTCRGQCQGTCDVEGANGDCAGKCDGQCQGTCELNAGGSCTGKCTGSCEYTPPSGSCEATAEARCEASANADIKCKGGCEGNVRPPQVKAECEASVEAKANASIECTPPALDVTWQWSAELQGDVNAQAEFKAWVTGFKARYAGMLAATAKADILVQASGNLVTAAEGAVKGAFEGISASGDLKATIGAGCALTELPKAADALRTAGTELQGSLSAFAEISAVVGG